jgi:hypothetical protein
MDAIIPTLTYNRANIVNIKNVLYVRVGIIASFILTMFVLVYVTVGIIASFILTMFALLYVTVVLKPPFN